MGTALSIEDLFKNYSLVAEFRVSPRLTLSFDLSILLPSKDEMRVELGRHLEQFLNRERQTVSAIGRIFQKQHS